MLTFGVSGMLYKNNLLMYDHQTESLWLQVQHAAVTGPMTGASLEVLPSTLTTWETWRQTHPETVVLSTNTEYDRDYHRDPYAEYYTSRRTIFGFVRDILQGHEAKELVAGVRWAGGVKAYPLEELRHAGEIQDTLGGEALVLRIDPDTDTLRVLDAQGAETPVIVTYWFVWKDIHRDSERYDAGP